MNDWRPLSRVVTIHFHWDNPFIKQNSYHLFADRGVQAVRSGVADGNDPHLSVIVRPAVRRSARGFTASENGLHFSNTDFGDAPYSLPPLRGSFVDNKYGSANNGLCGGMVFGACDFFEAGMPPPATPIPPIGEQDPRFLYLVDRLFDSFTIQDVSLYLKYMHPEYPDTDENLLSIFGLVDGRASVVINTEWPMIRADIDAGHPSPLGLVLERSIWPTEIGNNHQVLAYAYLESGTDVTIWVYDPNQPAIDAVTINFSTRAWDVPLDVKHNVDAFDEDHGRRPIYCLVRSNYEIKQPYGARGASGSGVCAAVSRDAGHLDLFTAGNDGVVYTEWWNTANDWSGAQHDWLRIGGYFPIGSPVSAVSRAADKLDVFVTGNDGIVYTSWWVAGADWTGRANDWLPIGGVFPPGAPLAVEARTSSSLDLFVVGNDGIVYTSWWVVGEDWSGLEVWRPLVGETFVRGTSPASVSRSASHLDVFAVGGDGIVYTASWQDGVGWSSDQGGWRAIGGTFQPGAPIGAVARTPENLDLFVVGNDGIVYTSWWMAGQDWSGHQNWRPIGGTFPVGAPVAAVSRTPGNIDLFVVGNDGNVYTAWWYAGQVCQGRSKSGPLAPVEKCPTPSGWAKRLRAQRRRVAPSGTRSRLRVAGAPPGCVRRVRRVWRRCGRRGPCRVGGSCRPSGRGSRCGG